MIFATDDEMIEINKISYLSGILYRWIWFLQAQQKGECCLSLWRGDRQHGRNEYCFLVGARGCNSTEDRAAFHLAV